MINKLLLLSLLFGASLTQLLPTAYADEQNSLFSVPFAWTSEEGKPFPLSSLRGKPTLISMIYTQCKSACPLTIERVRGVETKLGEDADGVNFLLVTMDPGRDHAEELKHFKESHKINRENWHLLTGSESDVRKFSVLIGFSYQQDGATQDILHSNKLIVLAPDGSVSYSLEGLSSDTTPLIETLRRLGHQNN